MTNIKACERAAYEHGLEDGGQGAQNRIDELESKVERLKEESNQHADIAADWCKKWDIARAKLDAVREWVNEEFPFFHSRPMDRYRFDKLVEIINEKGTK